VSGYPDRAVLLLVFVVFRLLPCELGYKGARLFFDMQDLLKKKLEKQAILFRLLT
jgi:hypothetical protein